MNRTFSLSMAGLLVWLAQANVSHAAEVTLKSTGKVAVGDVVSNSRTEIVLKRGNQETKVPANDVARIKWDGEPARLNINRTNEANGRFPEAIAGYRENLAAVTDPQVKSDIEFLIARVTAKAALADPAQLDDAIKAMEASRASNTNTFRYYEVLSLLGRLYMQKPDPASAKAVFAELGQAPWDDLKMLAQIYDGRLLLQDGDVDGALAAFNAVASGTPANAGPAELARKREAMLGQASCLVKKQQYDQAAQVLDEVIQETPPEDTRLQAEAFLRQGDALQAQGKAKDAVLAYLHVDVLFAAEKELHAEALYHLARLWGTVDHPERAAEARAKLEDNYAGSPWTKKLAGGGG